MSRIQELGPVGFNPAGEYDSSTQYHRLDIVFYQDSSYVAKQDVIGQTPTNTTYWDELATSADFSSYYTKSEVDAALLGKYSLPSGGIPKTDLSSSVQTSLGKADSALQSHQDITGKEDKTNKVTSLSSASTDTQYPSAKCVYDLIGDISSAIDAINGEVV